jgi:FkbM family methyltransferase
MHAFIIPLAELSARLLPTSVKRWLYRTPWLAKQIRLRLNEAVPTGLTQTVVAAGPLKGAPLLLDLQREKDYWLGTYEMELMAGIADLVAPDSIAYDLGANIGYISLMLARCVGEQGRVYAFEALPSNQERLEQNIQLNKLEEGVIVVPAAVSDRSSVLSFMVAASGGMGKVAGSAGRHTVEYAETIEVNGIALDDFVYLEGKPAPDVIKIDIEGGEVLALPGMRRILKEKRPVIFLELHGPEAASVAWQELHQANYRLCNLTAGYPEVEALEKMDWKSYLVAFPRSEYGRY